MNFFTDLIYSFRFSILPSTLTPVNRSGAVMNQQRFDESTLIRIFALHELHRLKEHGLTRGALLDYHSRYKLVFLAHSQPEYRKLGPFVADIHQWQNLDDYYNQYRQRVIVLLSHPANRRDHTNVLMHVQGIFARILIPQNASSWRRLSTVIAVASNRFLRR